MSPIEAHYYSHRNKEAIGESALCGCFGCASVFPPQDICGFDDDGTARCPVCGHDTVIPSSAGVEINEEFLGRMKKIFFGRKP